MTAGDKTILYFPVYTYKLLDYLCVSGVSFTIYLFLSLSLVTLFKKAKRNQLELSFSLVFDKCSNVSKVLTFQRR